MALLPCSSWSRLQRKHENMAFMFTDPSSTGSMGEFLSLFRRNTTDFSGDAKALKQMGMLLPQLIWSTVTLAAGHSFITSAGNKRADAI